MMKSDYFLVFLILIAIGCRSHIKKEYYPNGNIEYEYVIEVGHKNGIWKHFGEDGTLLESAYFVDGYLDGLYSKYFSNSQVSATYNYRFGMLHGPYAEYYENGKIRELGTYVSDTLNGLAKTFDSIGNVITTQTICMGKLCGTYHEYYPGGMLFKEATYGDDGVFNGPYKIYFENGQVKEEGVNLNGNLNGEVSYFDSLGNKTKIIEYFQKGTDGS